MKIVIPLAGPDFERPDGTVKAEHLVDDLPLLRRTLETRPWWQRGQVCDEDLVFVLRDSELSRRFAAKSLSAWYPAAGAVMLPATTGGAALSALAGVAMIGQGTGTICIDLVDITYRSTFNPVAAFEYAHQNGAAALVFQSSSPAYSYLRADQGGRVIEAAEKKVISSNASAGTYFFANAAVYLTALAHSLSNRDVVTHQSLFFVCPLMNGVIASGGHVWIESVDDVFDIKTS